MKSESFPPSCSTAHAFSNSTTAPSPRRVRAPSPYNSFRYTPRLRAQVLFGNGTFLSSVYRSPVPSRDRVPSRTPVSAPRGLSVRSPATVPGAGTAPGYVSARNSAAATRSARRPTGPARFHLRRPPLQRATDPRQRQRLTSTRKRRAIQQRRATQQLLVVDLTHLPRHPHQQMEMVLHEAIRQHLHPAEPRHTPQQLAKPLSPRVRQQTRQAVDPADHMVIPVAPLRRARTRHTPPLQRHTTRNNRIARLRSRRPASPFDPFSPLIPPN